MGTAAQAPLPPPHLAARVGSDPTAAEVSPGYLEIGRQLRQDTIDLLPDDWSFEGKRVLDFGCGAGRALRHYFDEARTAEFHGCDIDAESIDWMERHMSPPFQVFMADERPPLARPDDFFDLIWAYSVFTHITDHWAAWLVELHRVTAGDGLLLVTFQGPTFLETMNLASGEVLHENRVGMNVYLHGHRWDLGGPQVLHSAWWIKEHWGRAFEILEIRESGFGDPLRGVVGQGVVLMRKRPVHPTVEELEHIEPGDPRETAALRHNIADLGRESLWFRRRIESLEQEVGHLEHQLESVTSSASWRVTAPLRRAKGALTSPKGE